MNKKRLMKPYCFFLKNYDGKINIDFVGKYENQSNDFKKICSNLGIEKELPKVNFSHKKIDFRDFYCEKSYKLVRDFYRDDFHYFNYSTDF